VQKSLGGYMKITVINCTQNSLIGFYFEVNYLGLVKILDEKKGVLCKETIDGECIGRYEFKFDWIKKLNLRTFIIGNSNLSIWCKSNIDIPDYAFGDRSFVIRK
jgi:hypothetical protein